MAIACDKRLGQQAMTVSMNYPKVFSVNNNVFYGLAGFASDVQTVSEHVTYKCNLYQLEEGRQMAPKTFANMLSALLYEKRWGPYFISPVIAGIDEATGEAYICSTDLIGCMSEAHDFAVGGTASPGLYGMCEALWEPDLGPEELFETAAQAMLNALDRDALSGWGAEVFLLTRDRCVRRTLRGRQD